MRVLQLVSVAVEVLGDAAQPHLGAVASALPQVRAHACRLLLLIFLLHGYPSHSGLRCVAAAFL